MAGCIRKNNLIFFKKRSRERIGMGKGIEGSPHICSKHKRDFFPFSLPALAFIVRQNSLNKKRGTTTAYTTSKQASIQKRGQTSVFRNKGQFSLSSSIVARVHRTYVN
jgi:hypothetical protein